MRGVAIVGLLLGAMAGAPALAQSQTAAPAAMSESDMRELVEAARATAKATREGIEYSRVVPDILTQILTKLDKIEDKLDKVEMAVKGAGEGRKRAPSR